MVDAGICARCADQLLQDAAVGYLVSCRTTGSQCAELRFEPLEASAFCADVLEVPLHEYVHLVTGNASVASECQEALDIRDRYVERPAVTDKMQPLEMLWPVQTIACRGARGRFEQPFTLVIAHGLYIDAGVAGELSGTHAVPPWRLTL